MDRFRNYLPKSFIFCICLMFGAVKESNSFGMRLSGPSPMGDVDLTLADLLHNHTVSLRTIIEGEKTMLSCCFGTLVHPSWIITSAHCLEAKEIKAEGEVFLPYAVFVKGTVHEVVDIDIYPAWFSGRHANHDIAMIKLASPVDWKIEVKLGEVSEMEIEGPLYSVGTMVHDVVQSRLQPSDFMYRDVQKVIGVARKVTQRDYEDEIAVRDVPGMNADMLVSSKLDLVSHRGKYSNANFFLEPGDSGSGLFNSKREILGITSRTWEIPVSVTRQGVERPYKASFSAWTPITAAVKKWITSHFEE